MRGTGLLIAMLFAVAGAAAASGLPDAFRQPIPLDRPDQATFNEAVVYFSNAVRKEHGRAPLSSDRRLATAAADHARNMARLKTHSHVLPVRGQRDLSQRMHRQSVGFRTAAENIAMSKVYRLLGRPISVKHDGCQFVYDDTKTPVPAHTYASLAEEVVDRWLASPKHRASLLSKGYRRLGAGVGVDRSGPACGDFYLVQDFAD